MSVDVPTTEDLLAAAFSSMLKVRVISQSEHNTLKKRDPEAAKDAQALNLGHLYKHTYKWGSLGAGVVEEDSDTIQVFIKTLTGNTKEVFISPDSTISMLKQEIEKELKWPVAQQRLIFADQQLENSKKVSDYSIGNHATLHIVFMLQSGDNSLYYVDNSLLAPSYDYDFSDVNDGSTKFYRGQFIYTRPCGWQRKALKVIGQYGDDRWLGGGGIRTNTTPGEWPVSYHSSALSEEGNIAEVGSKLSCGNTYAYSRGIFSTPLATVAARFAPTFKHRGQKYQVIFQNRINPATLQQVNQPAGDVYWASPKEEDVRPYNICLKKA